MISIYSYIPNSIQNTNFLDYFYDFTNDVSVSVSSQLIYNKIKHTKYKDLKISLLETTDLTKIYNHALSQTKHPIKLCLAYNEYIDLKYKTLWHDLANLLLYDVVDAYAIPLFSQDMKYIMSKWFLHKENCVRGQCITELLDYVDKSDGMDLINIDTKDIVPFRAMPITIQNGEPFVIRQ